MAIQCERLLAHEFSAITHAYTARDAILYALGTGLGGDPGDGDDLGFLLEDRLAVLPTFAVTLASPGQWIAEPQFGIDFFKLVHAEQAACFHRPLPPAADVVGRARVVSLTDRGAGRGAVLTLERRISDARSGELYCSLRQTLLLRGDGGFGGPPPEAAANPIPDRRPDLCCDVRVDLRAALIYRLSGDRNLLHADPGVAKAAGFTRPILHGLASYGMAGVAAARACGRSPANVTALRCRFSGVVYPGDVLTFAIWRRGEGATFQASVGDRKVLDQGLVSFEGST